MARPGTSASTVGTMAAGLTIAQAASVLGLTPRQIKHSISRGAPVVARGRKGRGSHCTLVDPSAIRQWMERRGRSLEAENRKVAGDLIRAVAQSTYLQFVGQSGPHKMALAASLLVNFYGTANVIRQRLGLPPFEAHEAPELIKQMDTLTRTFGRLR